MIYAEEAKLIGHLGHHRLPKLPPSRLRQPPPAPADTWSRPCRALAPKAGKMRCTTVRASVVHDLLVQFRHARKLNPLATVAEMSRKYRWRQRPGNAEHRIIPQQTSKMYLRHSGFLKIYGATCGVPMFL